MDEVESSAQFCINRKFLDLLESKVKDIERRFAVVIILPSQSDEEEGDGDGGAASYEKFDTKWIRLMGMTTGIRHAKVSGPKRTSKVMFIGRESYTRILVDQTCYVLKLRSLAPKNKAQVMTFYICFDVFKRKCNIRTYALPIHIFFNNLFSTQSYIKALTSPESIQYFYIPEVPPCVFKALQVRF